MSANKTASLADQRYSHIDPKKSEVRGYILEHNHDDQQRKDDHIRYTLIDDQEATRQARNADSVFFPYQKGFDSAPFQAQSGNYRLRPSAFFDH